MRLRFSGFSVKPGVRSAVRRRIALRTFYWRAKCTYGKDSCWIVTLLCRVKTPIGKSRVIMNIRHFAQALVNAGRQGTIYQRFMVPVFGSGVLTAFGRSWPPVKCAGPTPRQCHGAAAIRISKDLQINRSGNQPCPSYVQ
jgi:hypothetical protein